MAVFGASAVVAAHPASAPEIFKKHVDATAVRNADVLVGSIISLSPAAGQINVDPEIAKWTPIVARVQLGAAQKPYIFAVIGTMWWAILDGEAIDSDGNLANFSPMFRERSTKVRNGDTDWTLSILPNGGWWRTPIDIKFLTADELT